MVSVVEVTASHVPAEQVEELRGFADSMSESALRDVLLTLTTSVSSGVDVTLLKNDAELTPNQVAQKLRMSRTHLYALLDSGEIPFHRVGRDRRVRASDMIEFELRRQSARQELAEKFAHADAVRNGAIDDLVDGMDD